jgi:OOP family OmpA-OmpF porin
MKNKLILAALLMSSTAAFAGPGYIGVAAGSASQKLNIEGLSFSDDTTSVKLFGGYQVTPAMGVEVGYNHFGEGSVSGGGATIGAKPKTFYAALTGTAPVSPEFSITGKIGVASSKVTVFGTFEGETESTDENGTSAVFGVGLQYKISDTMSLVADYENFGKVAKDSESASSLKVSNISVGLRISF